MKRIPPSLSGLVSTLQAVEQLQATKIFARGRLALILLDTIFETACHVYIRNVARWKPKQIAEVSGLGKRTDLFAAVKTHSDSIGRLVDVRTWEIIDECHHLRNGVAHERPNEDVSAEYIREYYDTALKFLNTLFEIELDQAITMLQIASLIPTDPEESSSRSLDKAQIRALILAMQEYYAGQLDDAIARLSHLLAEDETAEARYLLALCYKRKGRAYWEAAAEEIGLAAAEIQADPAIQLEKADLMGRTNRPIDSLTAIEAAQKLGIDGLQILKAVLLKARAFRGLCEFTEALTYYKQAQELAERYATALHSVDGLIEVLINLRRLGEAITLVNSLIEREPRYSYAYVLRARVNAKTGNMQSALEDLNQAWTVSTDKGGGGDNRVLLTKATLYLDRYYNHKSTDDLALAEKELLQALPLVVSGFRPRFRNLLIHVYWEEDRMEDAYREASLSVAENRFEERNHQHFAFCALSMSRWLEAREAAATGIKLARQLVSPSVLCGAAGLIANAFCGMTEELQIEHQRWVAFLESHKGFSAEGFRWAPVQARITPALLKKDGLTRSMVNDVFDRLRGSS